MHVKKNQQFYLTKAAIYQDYADYYKYRNPSLHIFYYLQHLININQASTILQEEQQYRSNRLNFPAKFRILHSAPNTPGLDIYVDGKRTINEISYKQTYHYLPISPGKHTVEVFFAGESISSLLNKKVSFTPGKFYTLIITSVSKSIKLIAIEDQPNVPAGEAKIRFIHLNPETEAVDIAVKNRDVIFPELKPLKLTNYLGITPMNLELEARKAGTKEIAIHIPSIKLDANIAYSAVIAEGGILFLNDHPEEI
jgi:hypothetical protein